MLAPEERGVTRLCGRDDRGPPRAEMVGGMALGFGYTASTGFYERGETVMHRGLRWGGEEGERGATGRCL